jgi:ribonuclease J
MNMLALRCGETMIVIDAGMAFPEAELLGVDIVIPDVTFLRENRGLLKAIVLTHGHEDHIGALPYIMADLQVPVYGGEFTLALVRHALEERGLAESVKLREIRPKESFRIGPFGIEPIQVTHSLIDALALAVTTPIGTLIHTGDYKIDPTPPDGRHFDLHTIAEYGRRGVVALLSDSTNVERPGFTPSEQAVRQRLEDVFSHAPGKVVVACFASSIHRIQLVIELAQQFRRKLAIVGRSMVTIAEIAENLSRLRVPDGALLRPHDLRTTKPSEVAALVTGSQGEPMAVLPRAAVDSHRFLELLPSDTVVLSARIIPGNEKPIGRMINHILKRGTSVYYDDGASQPVHVSGHASQEELKLILNLVRPRYFIPIHGEYRQLSRHALLAQQMQCVKGQVIILESGQALEITSEGAFRREPIPAGRVCVDSGSLEEIEEIVIRDRQHLSADGIVVPIIAIDRHTGQIEGTPEIVARGFLPPDVSNGLLAGAKEVVLRTVAQSSVEEKTDWGVIKEKIRVDLRRYLTKETAKRPLVLPVILEI